MANQRCEAPAERRTTNQHQTPTQKTKRVPLPSQLVERLYSHAGPAGRRGAPGSGEEAQPDARGGVEAALEERRFGELRRWLHLPSPSLGFAARPPSVASGAVELLPLLAAKKEATPSAWERSSPYEKKGREEGEREEGRLSSFLALS